MNKKAIKRILEKYRKNEISQEEYHFLLSYYIDRAKRSEEMPTEEDLKHNLVQIENQLFKKQTHFGRHAWRYVAAAVLVLGLGVAMYYGVRQDSERNERQLMAVMPAKGKTTLRLPDGRVVDMGNAETVVSANNQVLLGKSSIDLNQGNYNEKALLEVETAKGDQFLVQLADGTKVWLNANSKLRYPVAFTGGERRVELSGEAYFEVAHNALKPFKVLTSDQTIKVLGTGFNVNSYVNNSYTVTTLVHGRVEVSQHEAKTQPGIVLSPGEQTTYSVSGLSKRNVDIANVLAWKSGMFAFQRSSIGSITRELANWYDVRFVITDQRLESRKITGEIPRNVSLYDIMEILSFFNVEAKISGETVYLNQKK